MFKNIHDVPLLHVICMQNQKSCDLCDLLLLWLAVALVTIMGLVNIMVFLSLMGKLGATPIKFVFDLDPPETSERGRQSLVASSSSSYPAIDSENNEERQTRELSGMLRSHADNNGAQMVRYDQEQISIYTDCFSKRDTPL